MQICPAACFAVHRRLARLEAAVADRAVVLLERFACRGRRGGGRGGGKDGGELGAEEAGLVDEVVGRPKGFTHDLTAVRGGSGGGREGGGT